MGTVAQPLDLVACEIGTGQLVFFVIAGLRPGLRGPCKLGEGFRSRLLGERPNRGVLREPDEVDLVEPHALPLHHDLAAAGNGIGT